MANLGIADLTRDVGEHRGAGERHGTRGDVVVAGERPQGDVSVLLFHVAQLTQRPDVDEQGRLGQAEFHEREERMAAGEQLGVVAVLDEQCDRLVQGTGPYVVELGGDHVRSSGFTLAASAAATML